MVQQTKGAPSRVRAFRAEDAATMVARRVAALAGLRASPHLVRRALREARKAAWAGAAAYDPARHAALLRVARDMAAEGPARLAQAAPRRDRDQSPSNKAVER